jgi:hypothetical protein
VQGGLPVRGRPRLSRCISASARAESPRAAAGLNRPECRLPVRGDAEEGPYGVTRWQESRGKWKPGPVMVWTPQQTGEFLDAIEGDRLYPLYSLAAFAGLRRAEVTGLPWSENRPRRRPGHGQGDPAR